jgi:hypothetical protein
MVSGEWRVLSGEEGRCAPTVRPTPSTALGAGSKFASLDKDGTPGEPEEVANARHRTSRLGSKRSTARNIPGAADINEAVRVLLLCCVFCSVLAYAQEVKYVDLSSVSQRTQLRHPPAPPLDCKEGEPCVGGGGIGGVSVSCGAPDHRDPHALGIYLLSVAPAEIDPSEAFEVEFKVLNTGGAPLDIPVSPHLSDLQSPDESLALSYFSLALVVRPVNGPAQKNINSVATVELYGTPDREDSMMILKPGEWVRVRAKVRLSPYPTEAVSADFRGEFWLRRNTFHPHPGGGSTEIQNLYPNTTPTPSVPVRLVPPATSQVSQ